ncbi:MAG: Fe-S cluster assembly sulfur transfer protein SufU [Acidimicrobiales bacterium]
MTGLEDLYREIILDHYRSPRNRGELAVPPAHRVEGFNPLCGDEVVLYIDVEGDTLKDLRISGQGCSISQSSASMMSAAVKGKPTAKARELIGSFKEMMTVHEHSIGGAGAAGGGGSGGGGAPRASAAESLAQQDLGELAALQGVVKFPVRIKCATLSWNTLLQGLDELEAGLGEHA